MVSHLGVSTYAQPEHVMENFFVFDCECFGISVHHTKLVEEKKLNLKKNTSIEANFLTFI